MASRRRRSKRRADEPGRVTPQSEPEVDTGDGDSAEDYAGFEEAINVSRRKNIGKGEGQDPGSLFSPEALAPRLMTVASGRQEVTAKGAGASRAMPRDLRSSTRGGAGGPEKPNALHVNDAWMGQVAEGPSVGIDFGTSNCCVAEWREKDEVVRVINDEVRLDAVEEDEDTSANVVPTAVSFAEWPPAVGFEAVREALDTPNAVVRHVKRVIGRPFSDDDLKTEARFSDAPLREAKSGADEAVYLVPGPEGGKSVERSAVQVASEVFSYLATRTRRALRRKVTNCVVGVPIHFSSRQREAVIEAAALAGWNVIGLINEPTAAAMAYGFFVAGQKRILVFDLGGGTLDVSLVDMNEGRSYVVVTGGDVRLGGEEFTRALMRHVATLRPEISSSDAADRDLRSSRSNCERAKVRLTSVDETSVYDAVSGLEFTVTRKEFNAVCSELFDRCISVVGGVLSDANCDVGDIDRVVLIGGATRMPELKARLAAKFGAEKLYSDVHPDEAVALGAAIQAALLCGADPASVRDTMMTDVAALSVGFRRPGSNDMVQVIARNTPIPMEARHMLVLPPSKRIPVISVDVFEGESTDVRDNKWRGFYDFHTHGASKVELLFQLSPSGILTVHARPHGVVVEEAQPADNVKIKVVIALLVAAYLFVKLYFAEERILRDYGENPLGEPAGTEADDPWGFQQAFNGDT